MARMTRAALPSSAAQRKALLEFEALYEEWRIACERLSRVESQVIAESLRHVDGRLPPAWAEHLQQARTIERSARGRVALARDALEG